MPSPMTPEFYTLLAQEHNDPIRSYRKRHNYNPLMPIDYALKGELQPYVPETVEDEYDLNEIYRRIANDKYDEQQPYGFEFGGEHAKRLEEDAAGMYYDPNWAGPRAFEVGESGTPYEGDVYIGDGVAISQPGDEGFIGDVKNALVPVAKTAGSYALPMLFSMLMRGGK